jgi:hyperosmotically inducible periplasmic protein
MKSFQNRNTLFRNTLIAAALSAVGAVGIAGADANDTTVPQPQPQSDNTGMTNTDSSITAQVKAKLMADDSLKGSNISVTTTDGVVSLAGTLATSASKQAAIDLTKGIAGVKSVDTTGLSSSSG